MRYPHLLAALYGQPWALHPRTLSALKATLESRLASASVSGPLWTDPEDQDDSAAQARSELFTLHDGIAVIPVSGIIGKHLSLMETRCGGYDVDSLGASLAAAEQDSRVAEVLLDIDSPGGSVSGVPEIAAKIRAFAKPVTAYTDTLAASAAYWIGSQASEGFFVSPSAEVGSIGVYTAIVDESAAWARDGYRLELMKAGDHKAAGIPGLPLSDADRALLQDQVNTYYGMFAEAVSNTRKGIGSESMQGQTFIGEQGITAGLADGIIPSVEDMLNLMAEGAKERTQSAVILG